MINQIIESDSKLAKKLELLYQCILESPVNVTAIKEKNEFYLKHVLDSIYFFIDRPPKGRVADVGSGGGFPGLVTALFYPKVKVTLIDSVGKKCRFMENCITSLEIDNVDVINSRAENIKGKTFDLITARGVGSVKEVLEYTSNLVHDDSRWLMYKGARLPIELEGAKELIKKRGLKSETIRVETPFKRTYLYLYH